MSAQFSGRFKENEGAGDTNDQQQEIPKHHHFVFLSLKSKHLPLKFL